MTAALKIWRVPYPRDYHKRNGYYVSAATKEEAIEKVKSKHQCNTTYDCDDGCCVKYDEVKEVTVEIWEDGSCDC
ncbi:MAG: hypothetical protein HY376_03210 [Candidatus Blackburnbacteria bacterium]|nr:hypothetical protein [Candidatus Blackburnbacteria bacterium]